jgi:hypothetical protein
LQNEFERFTSVCELNDCEKNLLNVFMESRYGGQCLEDDFSDENLETITNIYFFFPGEEQNIKTYSFFSQKENTVQITKVRLPNISPHGFFYYTLKNGSKRILFAILDDDGSLRFEKGKKMSIVLGNTDIDITNIDITKADSENFPDQTATTNEEKRRNLLTTPITGPITAEKVWGQIIMEALYEALLNELEHFASVCELNDFEKNLLNVAMESECGGQCLEDDSSDEDWETITNIYFFFPGEEQDIKTYYYSFFSQKENTAQITKVKLPNISPHGFFYYTLKNGSKRILFAMLDDGSLRFEKGRKMSIVWGNTDI